MFSNDNVHQMLSKNFPHCTHIALDILGIPRWYAFLICELENEMTISQN